MSFAEFLQNNIVYLDGAMGTLLQERGIAMGEKPEVWNITHPEEIVAIHKAYYDRGSNVVCTNTFGANLLKFSQNELEKIVRAAVKNAKQAREESEGKQEKFVALDIGPCGKMLKPYGDLDFEDAVKLFGCTIKAGASEGVDLVIIETMNDSYETKAAILAAKESCDLPIIVCNAYGEDGKLMTGANAEAMVALCEGLGVSAVGANCSLGPDQLASVAKTLLAVSSLPVVLKPNAGLPRVREGKTVFDVKADGFARQMEQLARLGLRVMGGCCGTTPEHIGAMIKATKDIVPQKITDKNLTVVSSYTHAVYFGNEPVLIGERINPTGKKRFKQALRENDVAYILNEGLVQQEKGVHVLDVNVGLPEIDEASMLKTVVCELQAVIDLPLQIDTGDEKAMEKALRCYNGKPMINSVNGKMESMQKIFPLAKKYGGVIIALTLDERGIPATADERISIAKKILDTAKGYGISPKDIVFDTLAMTVSADEQAANATLQALGYIRKNLGCNTSLGVSNVSFGLPSREVINSTFFTLAMGCGLSAAIINPTSEEMMKAYYAYCALSGWDKNCARYIEKAESFSVKTVATREAAPEKEKDYKSELERAVIKGLKDVAAEQTEFLLKTASPLSIVNEQIIPALDKVGEGYEKKTVYLPQLLMSAEAAKSAFEVIKKTVLAQNMSEQKKSTFVIATVHGDVHDIGKNIVKLILENYGFNVVDLGRDVDSTRIADEVVRLHAPMVGLSALMTTTVPSMEEAISLIRKQAPWCKIVVGGAVLTQEYADKIGADKYARDAMETVRYAEAVHAELQK